MDAVSNVLLEPPARAPEMSVRGATPRDAMAPEVAGLLGVGRSRLGCSPGSGEFEHADSDWSALPAPEVVVFRLAESRAAQAVKLPQRVVRAVATHSQVELRFVVASGFRCAHSALPPAAAPAEPAEPEVV